MRIAGALALLVIGLTVGFVSGNARQSSASAGAVARQPAFIPACPHGLYSPDGNYSPLFCKIDDPGALRWYRPISPHLWALTAAATPLQVQRAMTADVHRVHTTPPQECSSLQLWEWTRHWQADGVTFLMPGLC